MRTSSRAGVRLEKIQDS
jgi:hypothetical protein